jgi:hypothetical protein
MCTAQINTYLGPRLSKKVDTVQFPLGARELAAIRELFPSVNGNRRDNA